MDSEPEGMTYEKQLKAWETNAPILKYFRYSHLPQHLQEFSRPFAALAVRLCATLEPNAERTVALRKLLESKDAAVRAALP